MKFRLEWQRGRHARGIDQLDPELPMFFEAESKEEAIVLALEKIRKALALGEWCQGVLLFESGKKESVAEFDSGNTYKDFYQNLVSRP
ncbi:MAG: hypothetical protein COV31_02455 [Candidatus Yanofskybacteria bacterium CG10_big_fil_rev_8_21_14_0_10_46_23]|uniref:Uncharacterized protein n=1 Tax=Candidatus Yanofskybacteria bacterium CG10_big_fil_rev_8_21_14_0_10_46_23 TaxID=1975098 RepID=A0A2H0R606_9BACT|nr:MAG: hypothetical protein COV31_02455 [Candidatus Yanofskybacteria bacterium CG10_big_fil_rev_8_21_14_0_10_46_23]